MPATFHNLNCYGLALTDLPALGDRPVEISGSLRGLPLEPLLPFSPAERKKRLKEHLEDAIERIRARWPSGVFEIRDHQELPWDFDAVLPARALPRLLRSRELSSLFIHKIQGLRRKPEKKELSWYAVRGRVAIQVEGQTQGLQEVEDRIVVVRAHSFEDAERRLRPNWEEYAEPYLNSKGEMVRWQLEEIVDVYQVGDLEKFDPKGTEVYSRLTQRRVRPDAVWRPRKAASER
jgi:Domain of unknown function (DUF4288)